MSLNAFERRFVINLPYRTDRRRDIEAQLRAVGLSAEIFPAFRFDDAKPFHRVGSRGNYMSQLAVLKLSLGATSVLVMEDDLGFIRDTTRLSVVDQLPKEWGIFYGSVVNVPHDGAPQGLRQVLPNEEFIGSHLYAINGWVIPKLVAALETFLARERDHPSGGPMPIDGALNVFRRQNPHIATFMATPAIGYQRSSKSDVAEPKWFDRPLTAPLIRKARLAKNWLRRAAGR